MRRIIFMGPLLFLALAAVTRAEEASLSNGGELPRLGASKTSRPASLVPNIKDFGFSLDFSPELGQVAANFQNGLEYTPALESTIIYFDSNSKAASQPQAGGYYRKILGKTDKNQTVAQDFYQDSQQPQTSPFIVLAGKEKIFSGRGVDGRVIAYDRRGAVSHIANYHKGSPGQLALVQDGKIIAYQSPQSRRQTLILDEQGQPSVLLDPEQQRIFYFHPNGQAMAVLDSNGLVPKQSWDRNGQLTDFNQLDKGATAACERRMKEVAAHLSANN